MGENKHIEELDAFAKKYVKQVEVEIPSIDFTSTVMQSILKVENTALYKPTPLISKKVWFVVFGVLIALLCIPFKTSEKATDFLDKWSFSFSAPNLETPSFLSNASFSISTITVYAFVFLALLILVQVHLLKQHFINKLEN